MIYLQTTLRIEEFIKEAEKCGLKFVSKKGLKLLFELAEAGDETACAQNFKIACKANPQLNTVYFAIGVE